MVREFRMHTAMPQSLSKFMGKQDGSSVLEVGAMLLNEFNVERELGRGGMGKVYLVRSCTTGRHFAVKEALVKDESHRRSFLAELQTWIDLPDHPNILACRFFRTVGDEILIFADYVERGSLADWIAQGRLTSLEQKLDVAIQFAWGLHAVHEHCLIHQDVKPGNVLMTKDGTPKVADFGLARSRQRASICEPSSVLNSLGQESILVSSGGMTPAYASPEQRSGRPLSRKTDMWSWAVSVMDMFLGGLSCPYGGHIAADALDEIVSTSGDVGDEQIPEDVAEVLRRCFQVEPSERWANLAAVVDALCSVYRAATGKRYNRICQPGPPDDAEQADLPSHGRCTLSPENWLACADELTGRAPQLKRRAAATVKGSLIEAIRMMDDVVPVMERFIDDARRDSIQRYFDAVYVSADLHRRLSDEHGCLDKLRAAIHTLQSRDTTRASVRLVLGDAYHACAVAYRDFRHCEEALEEIGKALGLLESTATANEPGWLAERAAWLQTLASILGDQGKHSEALRVFERVIAMLDKPGFEGTPGKLALALNNAGICARNCGLRDMAIAYYQRCIQIRESIVVDQPDVWESKDQIAGTLGNLSAALCKAGQEDGALEAIDKAVFYRSEILRENAEPELRVSLAKARFNRASVLFQMERWSDAVREYAHVVAIVAPLLELEGRSDLRSLMKDATSSQDAALRRIEERSIEEADALYADVVPAERRAMVECPGQRRGVMLARLLSNWAGMKRSMNQMGAAWLLLEEAIGLGEELDRSSQFPETADALIMCYRNLSGLLVFVHAFSKAEAICAKGREYCAEVGRVGTDSISTESYCTITLCLAHATAAQGRPDRGAAILSELNDLVVHLGDSMPWRLSLLQAINEARGKLQDLVSHGADPQLLLHSQCIGVEAQSRRQVGDIEGATRLYEKALELNPSNEALWINLSVAYAKLRRYDEGIRCCDLAIALNPSNGTTWLNRGLLLFERHHFADAEASFTKAQRLGVAEAEAKAAYCRDIVDGRI